MKKKIKEFFNKNRKIILVGAAALVVVVIVALLASGILYEPINEDYFVSDGGKLVLSLPKEISNYETSEYEPDVTHVVYYYNGNKINNVRIFYAYDSEEEAREANNNITMDGKKWATGRKLNGKYIIFNTVSKEWEKLTTEYIRNAIENLREVDGLVE